MSRKKIARKALLGIVFGAILLAIARAYLLLQSKNILIDYTGEIIEISGTVIGDPDISGESSSAKLSSLIFEGKNVSGTVYLYGTLDPVPERGDHLKIRGKLSSGFGTYVATFFRPTIIALEKPEPGSITLKFRNILAKNVKKVLGERESRLGLAYLFGMRNELDGETLEILSAVGLMHLVVASGTHLGIIVDFFKKRLGKISRFAGTLFSLIFILLFGQLIGWTASITRAAIVTGLTIIGWHFGRKLEPWRVILIAMAVTLTINPMNIIDLGWLLSFASFIGIIVLKPIIAEFFYGRNKPKQKKVNRTEKRPGVVADIIITSASAMVMCAPILVYYFGSISIIAIIANLLVLPTIPLAMGLTFLVGLLGMLPIFPIFDAIKWVVSKIIIILLDYHYIIMEFFSKQTSLIINVPRNNPLVFLLYIPVLLVVIAYCARRSRSMQKAKLRVLSNPEHYLPYS